MTVVVMLVALMISITFPAIGAGLEALRLRSGASDTVATFNAALSRAERFQDAVVIQISPRKGLIEARTIATNTVRRLELPEGVSIVRVLPAASLGNDDALADREFILYPDGAVPRIALELANRRGTHRLVALDPITGVARQTIFVGALDDQAVADLFAGKTGGQQQ